MTDHIAALNEAIDCALNAEQRAKFVAARDAFVELSDATRRTHIYLTCIARSKRGDELAAMDLANALDAFKAAP